MGRSQALQFWLEKERLHPAEFATISQALNDSLAFDGSMADFEVGEGPDITDKCHRFFDWQTGRRRAGLWTFSSSLHSSPSSQSEISLDDNSRFQGVNLASQDYLGLSSHPLVQEAGIAAIRDFGPHSAGSGALQGNTHLSLKLEEDLKNHLQCSAVTLFPTGWAAGFGSMSALIRPSDHVVMDQFSHNCLVSGATYATKNVHRFRHLSEESCRAIVSRIRKRDPRAGILVVTEGLFSMDSDVPDFGRLRSICDEYEAFLLVDIAHDLGALGPQGTGMLGEKGALHLPDFIVGSFSKSFSSNGGFLASRRREIHQYVKYYANSYTFSNALSPVQSAIVLEALKVIRSSEGDLLRSTLIQRVTRFRQALMEGRLPAGGSPSPIVPVDLVSAAVARLTAKLSLATGCLVNLVEYPAVSVGVGRLRLQCMATHSEKDLDSAAKIILRSHELAAMALNL